MRTRTYENPDLIFGSIKTVPTPGLVMKNPGARGRKVVLLRCLDKPRRRGGQFHKIRRVQALREKIREAHLRSRCAAGEQQPVRIGKTCGNDYFEPRVQGPDEHR